MKLRYAALGILATLVVCVVLIFQPDEARGPVEQRRAPQAARTQPHPAAAHLTEFTDKFDDILSVNGTVTRLNGAPIAGATVKSIRANSVSAVLAAMASPVECVSDADGAFSLDLPLVEADYIFTAAASGYLPAKQEVRVAVGAVPSLHFELTQTASIQGIVVDMDGLPVSHVLVSGGGENITSVETPEETSVDGQFALYDLAPSRYSLYARYVPPGLAPSMQYGLTIGNLYDENNPPLAVVDLREGQQVRGVRLVLPWNRGQEIRGVVLDESSTPLPNVRIWASDALEQLVQSATDLSDDQGRFAIPYIPRLDVVDLRGYLDGYEESVAHGIMVGSKDAELTMIALKRGSILVTVLESRTRGPVADARVFLSRIDTQWGERELSDELIELARSGGNQVDADGTIRLEDVKAGRTSLLVYSASHGMSMVEGVDVAAGEETSIECLLDSAATLELTVEPKGLWVGCKAGSVIIICSAVSDDGEVLQELGQSFAITPSLQDLFLGKPEPPPGPAEFGTYTLTMQPGTYEVFLECSPLVVSQLYLSLSATRQTFRVTLRPGELRRIVVSVGGDSTIEGAVGSFYAESTQVCLFLDTDDAPPIGSTTLPTGTRYRAHVSEDHPSYLFYGVPAGTHLLVVRESSGEGMPLVRETRVVEIRDGESAIENFF